MNYYIDIRVLPDPEFTETVLMNAVYSKLHRVLMSHGQGHLGISFPNHKITLGNTLRVHGTEGCLRSLTGDVFLKGLSAYTVLTDVSPVPSEVKYRCVSRRQVKSRHNVRQRSVRKGWLTEEEALEKYPDTGTNQLRLPFAQLKSFSNKSRMKLFVEHGELRDEAVDGIFSSYGLSPATTIPWF